MITARGAALVATAIFTFLLARLTQVGWLYLLDAMLWGVILLSLAVPWLAVTSTIARRRILRVEGNAGSLGPSEGEVIQLQLSLEDPKPWPRYLLSAGFECPLAPPSDRWQRYFLNRISGRDSMTLVSELRCNRRGLHELGPRKHRIQGPLWPLPTKETAALAPVGTRIPTGVPTK